MEGHKTLPSEGGPMLLVLIFFPPSQCLHSLHVQFLIVYFLINLNKT